ncbi:MAG: NAD(P)H-dependent glycerol-3-phosphate dehydrogenase [Xanthobacteraceae bacterium]
MTIERVAIVGAGAWGTALANVAARAGRSVTLLARNEKAAAMLSQQRENARLPGVKLADGIAVALGHAPIVVADVVLLAVPAQSLRAALTALPPLKPATPLVICAKGIERNTHKFMSEIVAEIRPDARVAIMSGPSFAADVGRGLPAAVTLAAQEENLARELALALGAPTFRLYHSTDVRGVEIGGAAKNVLAIAAGIVTGKKLGASAAAALTTRGFAELLRFARAYGAKPETIMGLSGLGDLILTCSSTQSRNYSLGISLGGGAAPLNDTLAEGAFTASALVGLAKAHKIDMPIAAAVDAVLDRAISIDEAIEALLMRPFKAE